MNSAKSRQSNGSWIPCIQTCRLSLAISSPHYVKPFGPLSMMKSTYPIVISTAIIRTLIQIRMVNPAVYGRLITFSTTRNSNVLFSLHAEQSSELNVAHTKMCNFYSSIDGGTEKWNLHFETAPNPPSINKCNSVQFSIIAQSKWMLLVHPLLALNLLWKKGAWLKLKTVQRNWYVPSGWIRNRFPFHFVP